MKSYEQDVYVRSVFKRPRWFVGRRVDDHRLEAFKSEFIPSAWSHGRIYNYCIGPFNTKRGAMWLERYPNTSLSVVCDIEKVAKKENQHLSK